MSDSPHSLVVPQIGDGASFDDLARVFASGERLNLSGAMGGSLAPALVRCFPGSEKVLVVTEDSASARSLHSNIGHHLGPQHDEAGILLFASYDAGPYDELVPDRRSTIRRASVLFRLATGGEWKFLIVSAQDLLRKMVPREHFEGACVTVSTGDSLDRDHFVSVLERGGYTRTPLVEEQGTYALRGGLLDVFPPYMERPVRVELFGNEVERMRMFDPETQVGEAEIGEIWVHPSRLTLLPTDEEARLGSAKKIRAVCDEVDQPTGRTERLIEDVLAGRLIVGAEGYAPAHHEELGSLMDYLPSKVAVCVDNPTGVRLAWAKAEATLEGEYQRRIERREPAFPIGRHIVEPAVVEGELVCRRTIVSHRLLVPGQKDSQLENCEGALDINAGSTAGIGERLRHLVPAGESVDLVGPLAGHVSSMSDAGYRVVLVAHTPGQAERLVVMLEGRGVEVSNLGKGEAPGAPGVYMSTGELAGGCVLPGEGICWIAEEEVFGRRARRRRGGGRSRTTMEDLRALGPGDLVVHSEHGIGRYEGLHRQKVRNAEVDFLHLVYRDGDKLLLPVYRLNQIQKYRSVGDGTTRLDKLGGQTFSKKKAGARKHAMEMAARLLDIYARREVAQRPPAVAPDELYREFEAGFPFEETDDQERAISEVMSDLDRGQPMDRLICGDVGFGKTEVALRAAFRVVMSGRQVVVLVPTTVLAQQHYQGFARRFADYPVRVEMMSRFRTDAQNSRTALGLKDGTVDIVIGTHRLLSSDVHLKRLGLLVIDEEHRFGVAHKERIRSLRASVDTLVLTATPIPRTLHMAFAKIRDLSLMATAPVDRRPIKTVACHDDPDLLRKAMERELGRDGQVFFVHNRVRDIGRVAQRVRELVPEARVAIGHGQMKEEELERVMLDFVAGRYDILVCTAIIESGLDITRANTIIVDRADTFGLAQLYQIRGRVGRSHVQAYAYLVVPPLNMLGDDARERVEALTRHSDLGSGFSIATLDLEIRGAGNLLGAEQSGDVAGVGFDMYCELLAEESARLQGKETAHDVEPEMTLENPGFLPEDYIPDVGQRLQYYKRLASADGEEGVERTAADMVDRFGSLPDETRDLVRGMSAKALCRELGVLGLEAGAKRITIHLGAESRVDPEKVLDMVRSGEGAIRLTADMKLQANLDGEGTGGAEGAIRFLRRLLSYEIKTG